MSHALPDRARDRLYHLADGGLSARRIAAELGVSRTTVGRYLRAREEAPRPVAAAPLPPQGAPFGPERVTGANTPMPAWFADQPPPPPAQVDFRPGYHDHTYRSFAAPVNFDGWTIERIRNAIAQHDVGFFLESFRLSVALRRFGPVFTALAQAIAPVLGLPRMVTGGTRGLSRLLAAEVESQIAPRSGLLPSPYFRTTIWGSSAIDVRMMGFAVLQHVYGDPDPQDDVRPLYTRRWPTWATTYYPTRRTFVAFTDAGPVDIITGDGKFTLLADSEEPHHDGAVRALGLEVLAGVLADQALASYVDKYGNPKLWGTMPEGVSVLSPEGVAFLEACATIRGPNGFGILPHGATLAWAQLSASQSAMFKEANEKVTTRVAGILLGSDGTMTSGTGGVYQSPYFWGVRRDIVSRLINAIVRGINAGHVAPYLDINYAASILEARGWREPVLSIPLPDPDADARQASLAERSLKRTEIIKAERDAGLDVTQERIDQISAELGLETVRLAAERALQLDVAPTDLVKAFRVREVRASRGAPPLGDKRDDLLMPELAPQVLAGDMPAEPSPEPSPELLEEPPPTEPEEPLDPEDGATDEPEDAEDG